MKRGVLLAQIWFLWQRSSWHVSRTVPMIEDFFYFILSLSSIYRLMVLSPLFVVLIHESLWSKPRRLSTPTRTELAFKLHLEELILLFPLFLFFSSKLFALLSPFSVLSAQVAFSLREGRGIWVTWVVSILPWSPTICMERRE